MSRSTLDDIVAAEVRRLGQGAPVEVSLLGGVATLTGEVPDEARRLLIEQGLLQLPEVEDVHNHLRVTPPAGGPLAQLRAILEREGVRLPSLGIEVQDGQATLFGRAEGWFDRDAAERLAWTLPGVRGVTNRIILPEDAVTPDPDSGEGLPV